MGLWSKIKAGVKRRSAKGKSSKQGRKKGRKVRRIIRKLNKIFGTPPKNSEGDWSTDKWSGHTGSTAAITNFLGPKITWMIENPQTDSMFKQIVKHSDEQRRQDLKVAETKLTAGATSMANFMAALNQLEQEVDDISLDRGTEVSDPLDCTEYNEGTMERNKCDKLVKKYEDRENNDSIFPWANYDWSYDNNLNNQIRSDIAYINSGVASHEDIDEHIRILNEIKDNIDMDSNLLLDAIVAKDAETEQYDVDPTSLGALAIDAINNLKKIEYNFETSDLKNCLKDSELDLLSNAIKRENIAFEKKFKKNMIEYDKWTFSYARKKDPLASSDVIESNRQDMKTDYQTSILNDFMAKINNINDLYRNYYENIDKYNAFCLKENDIKKEYTENVQLPYPSFREDLIKAPLNGIVNLNSKNLLDGNNSSSYFAKVGTCNYPNLTNQTECKTKYNWENGKCTKPKYVFVDNSPKSSNLIESVQESINELAPEELISYLNGDVSQSEGLQNVIPCGEGGVEAHILDKTPETSCEGFQSGPCVYNECPDKDLTKYLKWIMIILILVFVGVVLERPFSNWRSATKVVAAAPVAAVAAAVAAAPVAAAAAAPVVAAVEPIIAGVAPAIAALV